MKKKQSLRQAEYEIAFFHSFGVLNATSYFPLP